jgi:hypothetical protein
MTRLCDIPFEDVEIGLRVVGANGALGAVEVKNPEDRFPSLDILWDGGTRSRMAFHHLLSRVIVESEGRQKARLRPANYDDLSPMEQWEIDKQLGILDWDGQ